MGGDEIRIEKDCVRLSYRTFLALVMTIVSLVTVSVIGYVKIVDTQERILATMRVVIGTCCPPETKRFFDELRLSHYHEWSMTCQKN